MLVLRTSGREAIRKIVNAHQQPHMRSFSSSHTCLAAGVSGMKPRISPYYDYRIIEQAKRPIQHVTIENMVEFGAGELNRELIVNSAKFLKRYLTTGLARRIDEMQHLPYGVVVNPHMQSVYTFYKDAFDFNYRFPEIKTPDDAFNFTEQLPDRMTKGKTVLPSLARASKEIASLGLLSNNQLSKFLNNFLSSRIGRRILIGQHLALHRQFEAGRSDPTEVGMVDLRCDPVKVAREAFALAQASCEETYGFSPGLVIDPTGFEDEPISYLPTHLKYLLLELMKNSLRATVEHYPEAMFETDVPPIRIAFYQDDTEATIKITDQGCGIPKALKRKIFEYAFSTVEEKDRNGLDQAPDTFAIEDSIGQFGRRAIAGEGFGLPLVRVYAAYFDGTLDIFSIGGGSTEAILKLRHINSNILHKALDG